ncbi:hypothetical protein KH5_23240 [Urechidicola sp. KH5]
MLENDLLKASQQKVFELFKNDLPTSAYYHNYSHTLQVVNATYEFGKDLGVSESDMELLQLASWFHDTGYVKGAENHEEESVVIATKFLREQKVTSAIIEKVAAIIIATKMPQKPNGLLEEIICDADLYHFGTENFSKITNLVRAEKLELLQKEFTDVEWLIANQNFLEKHSFFTDAAYKKLQQQKDLNLLKIKKDLKKMEAKSAQLKEKEKLKRTAASKKKEKEDKPSRGVETVFRVTLRNHIKLSDIADTKANILLSVSAITLSIALTNLFPKLDKPDNSYLIYPTLIFIGITVVTMIFSILSTRPKITSGMFTKEDVENKKVNLLFFGNFHKMPLDEYIAGMEELIEDRTYLYQSLMKDLYFLGIVLNKKYRMLRVAYTIFMVGIIISVLSFLISFAALEMEADSALAILI